MAMHKSEANKIQEVSVTSPYLDNGGARHFLPYIPKLEDKAALHNYRMFDISHTNDDVTKRPIPWTRYTNQNESFLVLPAETNFRGDDRFSKAQVVQTVWLSEIVQPNIAPARSADLDQLWLHQLLRRLRGVEADKIAERIEYLAGEENAEDGGDIPTTASIASFVKFYFDNHDLGAPLLGATPNRELQAVWELPDRRRLVAEFLDNDIVKYVYRRAGNMNSSKLFIMGRQPRDHVQVLLEAASI